MQHARTVVEAPVADVVPRPRTTALPSLTASMSFDAACTAVLAYLQEHVPMGMWSVTRINEGDQVMLEVVEAETGPGYGLGAGTVVPFEGSFCQRMLGGGDRVVPVVEGDATYHDTPNRAIASVESYIGIPLEHPDGGVFGSICGFSSERSVDPEQLTRQGPLLDLLGTLLNTVLAADLQRVQAERYAEWSELQAETDALTGLLNRRGWDRYLEHEEQRYRRFGDTGAIVVLDLDRLKHVNDTLGHAAGDAHLRLAAEALRSSVRDADVLARLGGDEFGVVATRTSAGETAALVGRLRDALDGAGVCASFGHAPLTLAAGLAGAWRAADEVMYADKAARKARAGC